MRSAIRYLSNRLSALNYPAAIARALPIGSGLIEYFRSAVGLPEAVPAAVMVIHTFGQYLVDFHPHLHALVADGLFDPQGASTRCPRRSSSGRWKRCSAAG